MAVKLLHLGIENKIDNKSMITMVLIISKKSSDLYMHHNKIFSSIFCKDQALLLRMFWDGWAHWLISVIKSGFWLIIFFGMSWSKPCFKEGLNALCASRPLKNLQKWIIKMSWHEIKTKTVEWFFFE